MTVFLRHIYLLFRTAFISAVQLYLPWWHSLQRTRSHESEDDDSDGWETASDDYSSESDDYYERQRASWIASALVTFALFDLSRTI